MTLTLVDPETAGGYPYSAVVQVRSIFGDIEDPEALIEVRVGSGAVIGPNDVLTAASLLFDDTLGAAADVKIAVQSGLSVEAPPEVIDAHSWYYYEIPETQTTDAAGTVRQVSDATFAAYNFGVINLTEPLGRRTGTFGLATEGETGTYRTSGYTSSWILPAPEDFQQAYATTQQTHDPDRGTFTGDSADVDSGSFIGGPVWRNGPNGPVVSGVLGAAGVTTTETDADGTTRIVSEEDLAVAADLTLERNADQLANFTSLNDNLYAVIGPNDGVDDDVLEGRDTEATVVDDTLLGRQGDDVLFGGAGADWLDGGPGTDWAYYSRGGGVVVRLWSNENSGALAEGDRLIDIENLRGSDFADTLSGSEGDNVIEGLAGDDMLFGREGDDLLRGAHDNDVLDGGAGNDAVAGGPGNDILSGGSGDDALRGNSQNDRLNGGAGNDRVYGNIGGDIARGDEGADTLWGLSGNDRLYGGPGQDLLLGGFGGDILQGGNGSDTLRGDGGRDVFQFLPGDGGTDTIEGFEADGSAHDLLDLSRVVADIGYTGTTPVTDGVVRVVPTDGGAAVQASTGDGFTTFAVIQDGAAATLDADRFFVTGDDYWFGT